MFKFLKKLQRKENFKLIRVCHQMARRLQGLHTTSKACYVDDEASLQLVESLIEVIEYLEQTESWLEVNEVLSAGKSKELLDLHWTLTNMVKDMEGGREEGRKLAKERRLINYAKINSYLV